MTNNETFTAEQIKMAQAAYATIETVHPDMLAQFHAMFAKWTDAQLVQMANAQIKFVSKLARNAAVRRNLKLS